MVNAKVKLVEVFDAIRKDAALYRWASKLTDYVGHIVINGKTYEVTISLESDLDEMIFDPMEKDAIKLEAIWNGA